MLQKLLEEPLVCEAFEKTGQKGYKVTWKAHIFDLCVVLHKPTLFELSSP